LENYRNIFDIAVFLTIIDVISIINAISKLRINFTFPKMIKLHIQSN